MKRAKSRVIERFIRHVEKGLITGKELSSGPHVLRAIRDSLQVILDGENPDKALGIERKTGREPEPYSLPLAIMVHQWRGGPKGKREKWSVVERLANDLLQQHGYPPLSLPSIQEIYKEQKPRVYAYMNAVLFEEVIDIFKKQKAGQITRVDRERLVVLMDALRRRDEKNG